MSTDPAFNSPQLRRAFSETKQDIESLRTNLDLISRDIKELEENLDRNGIRIPVRGKVELGQSHERTRTILVWGECATSKRWRLLFEETTYDFEGDPISSGTKPLIETSAAIRIGVYECLPNFLRLIAKAVKVEPLKNRIQPSDLDFEEAPVDWDEEARKDEEEAERKKHDELL